MKPLLVVHLKAALPCNVWWIAALAGIAISCNLFETRPADTPAQTGADFRPPTEPSIVFSNMVNAFRDLNSLNYVRCFSDSAVTGKAYRFEATPQAQSNYGDVFQEWTRQSEQQYFDNIRVNLPQGSTMVLEFTFTVQSIQTDSAQFEASYRLVVPHSRSSLGQEARGRSQFFLAADRSRNWSIWRWVDWANNQTDLTWSEFKGVFGR